MEQVLQTLQVRLTTARRSRLGPQWHRQDGPQPYGRLYLLSQGSCILRHHGQTFRLRPGTVHVIPAGTPLDYRCPRSMCIDWIHFTARVLGGLDLFAYLTGPFGYSPRDLRHTRGLLRRLQQMGEGDSAGAQLESSAIVTQLLCGFVDLPRGGGNRRLAGAMGDVVGYIDAHLGKSLPVTDLAGRVGLSREAFTRQFAAAFGRPPAQFIHHRRVDAARRELLATDKSLAQIAAELGFADAFHFSRSFSAIAGAAPSRFRDRGNTQP